jgi:plastocyanin
MRRRDFIWGSGGLTAALTIAPGFALGDSIVEIAMQGRPDGSKVWFDPVGVLIRPGQTVRWTNDDKGNSHTATAYAAENYDQPRRIPAGAVPFDSDYLLPGDTFEVTLDVPGVYDYYCIPHEMSGMVGRIIVAQQGQTGFDNYPDGDLFEEALGGFPSIAEILAQGSVHKEE